MKYLILVLYLPALTLTLSSQETEDKVNCTANVIKCCRMEYYFDYPACNCYMRCCKCYYECCCRQRAISDNDFRKLIKHLNNLWFETDRIENMSEAIDYNYFNTFQARTLLQLLWFESSKVEIAKYIYPKITDKGNFYTLYDLFTFQSSVSEIREFIRN